MKQINLTQGKVALVDDDSYDRLNKFKWHAEFNHQKWYAIRSGKTSEGVKRSIRMHEDVLPKVNLKFVIDHIDDDGLNNQLYNLQEISIARNNRKSKLRKNSTGYTGVTKSRKGFKASIRLLGKTYPLGVFNTALLASIEYNKAFELREKGELILNG